MKPHYTFQSPFSVCPGTLAEGHTTYSKSCLNHLFFGRSVSPTLPLDPPSMAPHEGESDFVRNMKRLSISGVQRKFSLIQEKKIVYVSRLKVSKVLTFSSLLLLPKARNYPVKNPSKCLPTSI